MEKNQFFTIFIETLNSNGFFFFSLHHHRQWRLVGFVVEEANLNQHST
jgi:hypothetical protein